MPVYVNVVAFDKLLKTTRIASVEYCSWCTVSAICCGQSLGVANGQSWPSASEMLTVKSGARLRGWLACDGFWTFLVLMMLSAGQQKGHLSSWRGLPLRRGRSSWMVRVRE